MQLWNVDKCLPGLPSNCPARAVREPVMIVLVVVVVVLVVSISAGFEVVVVDRVVDVVLVFFFGRSVVVVGRGGALAGSGHCTLGINLQTKSKKMSSLISYDQE